LDDLIKKLLEEDPNKRLNWEEYFNHPFFKISKIPTSPEDMKVMVILDDFRNYYNIVEKIGAGGFGVVYKTIKKDTEEKRAIKIIDKQRIRDDYMNENFTPISEEEMKAHIDKLINEIKNMKIVEDNKNENTVRSYECFDNQKEFCIVMELCDNSLTKVFAERKQPYSIEEIKELLTQLNNSFKIMHENRLSHRDLKLDNILVKYGNNNNNKPIWKLADYGVSKQLASMSKNFSTKIGTLFFMAPEVLKGEKYKEKCDLWSLGIILYVLHFRDYPYKGENEIVMASQIETLGQTKFKKSGNDNFDDLIIQLLKANPNERIGWEEYFAHPFLDSSTSEVSTSQKRKNNQIIIKVKEEKNKDFKDIYFLENNKKEEVHNNEINESNIEVYINNKKIKFSKYFRPTQKGEYIIKLIFLKQMTDCSYMFSNCSNIISIDLSSFDSSNVTHMNYMFSECYNLNEINLTNLKAYNVIDMNHMFNKCHEFTKLEFPLSFSTQKITDMSFMFQECQKLSEIIFSKSFITNNVVNMKSIFGKCFKLKYLDLSNFNTENVSDMSYMFEQCNNLEKIVLDPSAFKTNKVVKMGRMFSECYSLKEIDLSSFNVEKVIHMSFMFNNCRQLTMVDLSKTKNNKEANMTHMFDSCSNIRKINISNFRLTSTTKIEKMFDNLEKIQKIIVDKNDIIKYKREFRTIEDKFKLN
jgi:surface protein